MKRAPSPAPESIQAEAALAALQDAIAPARVLGLDFTRAEAVAAEGSERLGISPEAYVVALVGGTGVGKSTILNALAGEVVSTAGPRRPTTGEPVAWVAETAADLVQPLLERLGIKGPRMHARDDLRTVVIVDLPDIDSLEEGHRAIVEAILPKVDVVAWVVDPEKYADAVLHDDFLREWMARLDRQVVILNKVDRLDGESRRRVAGDLGRIVRQIVAKDVPVIRTAAAAGEAGIAELRSWLADAAAAKAIVAARLAAAARASLAELKAAAGVGGSGWTPLVHEAAQRRAVDGAVEEVLRVVDLRGAERQAVAATRARARRRGTGPLGMLTSALYKASGRERKAADPAGFLRAWQSRGGLTRATELVRRAITDALPGIPPAMRARYAATGEGRDLEARLGKALDRVVLRHAEVEAPSSRLWPAIGLLQAANTLLLVFAVAWVILWVIARPEVASYDLPVLGPVPAPMVLLFVALAAGYVLARLLGLHAGWLGRRWARRLSGDVRTAVREIVAADAFAPIALIEEARAALAAAAVGDSARRSGDR
ncbi:MAG TPA: GTPase [Candidatus Limnocylindria bacterium]|nr:GTPase [Candidatus Limnocylindria bacterium]